MNLNLVKLNNNNNNNIGIYDQTMNKYSMKFFEKLNMNNNKNNKGIKYSNINELTNTINKNKLNNIKKDAIQIYNKEKNKNKGSEKQLINKNKEKKILGLGSNKEPKNNLLSSSYSNINNIIGIQGSTADNNNKIGNIFNNNFSTINFERKINKKNLTKLNNMRIEKITRNQSNPGKSLHQMNKNNSNNTASPINQVNKIINYNSQNNIEQKNK